MSLLRLLAIPTLATSLAAADDAATFRDKIAPLLAAHCASCHTGPQAQAALSIASLDDLLRGGKRGPAVEPGRSSASLLVQFLRGERNPRMPIGGKPLPDAAITALAAAIDSLTPAAAPAPGSRDHISWVFRPPVEPKVPAVRNAAWVRNPIDAFLLGKLEQKGIAPAPPASKRALLRRVYFDLIGLPPTEEEARQFLIDLAPDAYPKLVDRLLEDPRYGERWGRHWLDLVRFAESDGFAIDGERPTAWRYRDYVIRAFNHDKPYDEFVLEQLAGDEWQPRPGARGANAENEGLLALGFLRMGPWERDTNFDAQLRLDWLNEMAGTTSQVFLGLTVGCARCHDHKYDPIPQKDFYRLQAFFAATRIDDRPVPHLNAEGGRLAWRHRLRALEDQLEAANEAVKDLETKLKAKLTAAGLKEGELQKLLKEKESPVFTAAERQQHAEAAERAARLTLEVARHQPIAYSVNEVAPPAVGDGGGAHLRARRWRALGAGRARRAGLSQSHHRQQRPGQDRLSRPLPLGPAQSAGRMDGESGQSADGPRDGQPHLAAPFRRRHCPHPVRLRPERRPAHAPGAARLACVALHRKEVEHQGDAPADADLERLSAVDAAPGGQGD